MFRQENIGVVGHLHNAANVEAGMRAEETPNETGKVEKESLDSHEDGRPLVVENAGVLSVRHTLR